MMRIKQIQHLVLLFCMLGLMSCDKEEVIPGYVFIDKVDFQTEADQGTASSDFRLVSVLSGTADLGQYYLPALIPILEEGEVKLDVFPGINVNGIAATPFRYDLVKPISVDVNLTATATETLSLSATYKDILEFVFIEEFESENQIFREELDGDVSTTVELTDQDIFEGNRSGVLRVTDENPLLIAGSSFSQDFPPRAVPVYLELNYKSEIPLEIGLSWVSTINGLETSFQNAVSAKDEWGKIYIDFSEQLNILNNIAGIEAWQILLRARMPFENGAAVEGTREILVDNIKLIHYQ